ncbi:MAG: fibronectin type III domain-containing protein, partial [Patescibacteria group bacterium]
EESAVRATLTATETVPAGTSITYYLSADGGTNWEEVTSGAEHVFVETGSDLRWKAILETTDSSKTSAISEIAISYSTEIASTGGRRHDFFAPGNVSNVKIISDQENINNSNAAKLTWINPEDTDLSAVRIYRSNIKGTIPNEFIVELANRETEYINQNLMPDTTYYYSFATIDNNNNINLDNTQYSIILLTAARIITNDNTNSGNGLNETVGNDQEIINVIEKSGITLPKHRDLDRERSWIGIFGTFYGRLPQTQTDWEFVVFGAYNYRPLTRDLIKEVGAIGKFVPKFKYLPTTAFQWHIIRTLAYVGL